MSNPEKSNKTESPLKSQDLGLFLLGLACLGLVLGTNVLIKAKGDGPWTSGPLVFPLFMLGVCVLSSLPSAWRVFKYKAFSPSAVLNFLKPKASSFKLLLVLVSFLPCLRLFGIELTSFCLLALSLRMFGHKKSAFIIAGIVTLVVWFVFVRMLSIYFPEPVIFTLFGGN